MTTTSLLLSLSLLVLAVSAYDPCPEKPSGTGPACNATIFFGRCGSILSPDSSKWCTWNGQDICCAAHAESCCKQPMLSLALIAVLVVVGPLLCCCLAKFYLRSRRVSDIGVPSADSPSIPSRPVMSMDELMARLSRKNIRAIPGKRTNPPDDEEETPNPTSPPPSAEPPELTRTSSGQPPSPPDPTRPVSAPSDTQKDCIVCFSNPRTVILPCGHCQLCPRCANSFRPALRQCPSCRAPFSAFAEVLERCPSFVDLLDDGETVDTDGTAEQSEPSTQRTVANSAREAPREGDRDPPATANMTVLDFFPAPSPAPQSVPVSPATPTPPPPTS